MDLPPPREWLKFKHAHFTARFPADFRYSRSHYWMHAPDPSAPHHWRVGFTKFATRMLGELVDFQFTPAAGAPVSVGMEIGWVEGFKAASDVFSVMDGHFGEPNPALAADACIVRSDPWITGWLYSVHGTPEEGHLSAAEYILHLTSIIDKMAAEQHSEP